MLACKLTLRQVRETDKAKSFNYEFSLSLELANSFTGLRRWEFSIECTSLPRDNTRISEWESSNSERPGNERSGRYKSSWER